MPPPQLDFWPFDLEVGVGVACDLGCPCAKFCLHRPFGFRVRADVRDIRRTDRQTDDDDRLMPPPPLWGRGHNKVPVWTLTSIYEWKIDSVTTLLHTVRPAALACMLMNYLQPHSDKNKNLIITRQCLTLNGHIKTAEQRIIIQQYGVRYTGRWWMGCYVWYSDEGTGRARAPPSPLIAVPNVTAHPSTASVPTSYYLIWHYNSQCPLKG